MMPFTLSCLITFFVLKAFAIHEPFITLMIDATPINGTIRRGLNEPNVVVESITLKITGGNLGFCATPGPCHWAPIHVFGREGPTKVGSTGETNIFKGSKN